MFRVSEDPCHAESYCEVSDDLANQNACCCDENICPHQSESDADCRADDWKEGEYAHPGTFVTHESLRFQKAIVTHTKVFLNPLAFALPPNPVIEHAATPVTRCCEQQEGKGIQPGSNQCHHYGLAAERQEAASDEGRYEHAWISVLSGDVYYFSHRYHFFVIVWLVWKIAWIIIGSFVVTFGGADQGLTTELRSEIIFIKRGLTSEQGSGSCLLF